MDANNASMSTTASGALPQDSRRQRGTPPRALQSTVDAETQVDEATKGAAVDQGLLQRRGADAWVQTFEVHDPNQKSQILFTYLDNLPAENIQLSRAKDP